MKFCGYLTNEVTAKVNTNDLDLFACITQNLLYSFLDILKNIRFLWYTKGNAISSCIILGD
jgi:hypothetical protein